MKFILNKLLAWYGKFFSSRKPYILRLVDDLPQKLKPNIVYAIGTKDDLYVARLLCPCGCNEHLNLNLIPANRPCWTLQVGKKSEVSLHPSLWKKTGCKSHFFLKNGVVKWV